MKKEHQERHAELLERLRGALKRQEGTIRKLNLAESKLNEFTEKKAGMRPTVENVGDLAVLDKQIEFLTEEVSKLEAKLLDRETRETISDASDFLPTVFSPATEAAIQKYVAVVKELEPDEARARQMITRTPKFQNYVTRFNRFGSGDGVAQINLAIQMLEEIAERHAKKTLAEVF